LELEDAKRYTKRIKAMLKPCFFKAPFDAYFANDESCATLLLIRIGSKENSMRLCRRARELGMKLKTSDQGLVGLMAKRKNK